jgi:hypothetical protein
LILFATRKQPFFPHGVNPTNFGKNLKNCRYLALLFLAFSGEPRKFAKGGHPTSDAYCYLHRREESSLHVHFSWLKVFAEEKVEIETKKWRRSYKKE